MDKVYLVWSGEYSDRHVNEVFADKEKAEEYARIRNEREYLDSREEYMVEEWDLVKDTNYSDLMPENYILHIIYNPVINKITQTEADIPPDDFPFDFDDYYNGHDMDIRDEHMYAGGEDFSFQILRSYKEDIHDHLTYDRLLKIAQDRWAQFKARMEGIS